MQFAVVKPANRDRVFVAHFAAKRAGLGKADMMRLGWDSAAHKARLGRDELAMLLAAQADGLRLDSTPVVVGRPRPCEKAISLWAMMACHQRQEQRCTGFGDRIQSAMA